MLLPPVRECVTQAAQHLAEGVVLPGVAFYVVLRAAGLRWALGATLLTSAAVILVQVARRRQVLGVSILVAALFTGRTVIAFVADSAFVYLVQPSFTNFAVAAAFLVSLVAGRPLTRRLADDFCALPASVSGHPAVHRFFVRLTAFWAVLTGVTGAVTLVMAQHESVGQFLVLRAVVTYVLLAAGIVASAAWFRATMRDAGLRLAFAPRSSPGSRDVGVQKSSSNATVPPTATW